jgi:hypothetical protein
MEFRMRVLSSAVLAAALLAACGGGNGDDDDDAGEATPASLSLSLLGRYSSGQFNTAAAEIPAFDAASERGFVVNAQAGVLDVLDLSDPAAPVKLGAIDANAIAAGATVNSVAVANGIVAVAVQAAVKTDPGFVAFYRAADLGAIASVQVGALPDMLVFAPDGRTVLVANEGEPSDDYQADPEGSISVIDVSDLADITVRTAGFAGFEADAAALRAAGVRVFGPGASLAQDLEPEYIAVSADSTTAWATLQENNALARIDIATATVTEIIPLGFKDHGLADNGFGSGNALDTSDEEGGAINLRTWAGVRGLYHPDAIAAYRAGGQTYLVTANEGDARAWGEDNPAYWAGDATQGFVEEFRMKHLVNANGFAGRAGDDLPPQLSALADGALLDPATFGYCGATAGDPGGCRDDDQLGRLNLTWTEGMRRDASGAPVLFNASGIEDPAGDRLMYDALYTFGTRSFSIWNENGELVWDSGDAIERFLAGDECLAGSARNIACRNFFNSGHDEGDALDSRSDAKGPEPEGLTLGRIGDKTFLFLGLERMGGVLVYDITDPRAPVRVDYLNTREDWTTDDPGTVLAAAGDLGPEGLAFIPAEASPTGEPLLMVGNEVSGTTAIYRIELTF